MRPIPATATAVPGAVPSRRHMLFRRPFLIDAYYGYTLMDSNVEQPGLGPNTARDVYKIPGTNGTRRFESGNAGFGISGFEAFGNSDTVLPYFRHDPQSQYVANFNWTKGNHNIRWGFDIYRLALNHTQPEFPSARQLQCRWPFQLRTRSYTAIDGERQRSCQHICGKPIQLDGRIPSRSSHRWRSSAAGAR